jgi:hypothetical protein
MKARTSLSPLHHRNPAWRRAFARLDHGLATAAQREEEALSPAERIRRIYFGAPSPWARKVTPNEKGQTP